MDYDVITLTQNGSSVTGTCDKNSLVLNATVQAGKLAGTWADVDHDGTTSGFFEFEQSADEKSFTGRWVSTSEGAEALKNTTQFWNGVRV